VGAQSGWRLRLLDNFRLTGPDGEAALSARKAIALLAYLALQPDRMARREVLATLLWENADPAQARVSLRQAAAAIRRIEGDGPPILVSEGDFLKLTPDVEIDVRNFEQLAKGTPPERREAVALYRTDLLHGFSLRDSVAFNEWLGVEQARLRQRVVGALVSLIEEAQRPEGDLNAGIADSLHLLSIDPFNEMGHRGLMALYARQGRASLALAQYRALSDLLRRELGVAPEQATTVLYQELSAGRRKLPETPAASALELPPTVIPVPPAQGSEKPDRSAPPAREPRHRRRLAWVAGIGIAGAAAAAIGFLAWPGEQPPTIGTVYPITKADDIEAEPALSPDGEQLVFKMMKDGNTDLYLLPAKGEGTPLRLTSDPAADEGAAWRPDGLAIAFVRVPAAGDRPCEIVVKMMPAGDERVVGRCATTHVTDLDWMPDGKQILFSDSPKAGAVNQLYLLRVDTGAVRVVTAPPAETIGDLYPKVSADGRRAVFVRMFGHDATDVMLLDLATGAERRLTRDAGHIWSVVWYGRDSILFSADRGGDAGLWWLDLRNGAEPRRLSVGVSEFRQLAYSRKAKRLAFEAMQDRRTLLELAPDARAGTPPQVVPGLRPGLFDRFPTQSALGDIAFVSRRGGRDEIWIATPGQPARQRTRLGSWIIHGPSWSPDGTWIAFSGIRGGSSDLYMIRRDGGEPIRLTADAVEEEHPFWSPDGQYIYFGSRRGGGWRIWRMDPSRANSAQPVTGEGPWRAIPSSDGKALFYVVDGERGIRKRQIGPNGRVTGPEQLVVDLHPRDWRNWYVTRDAILYVAREGGTSAGMIRRHDLATGKETDLTDAGPLYWSASFGLRRDGGLLLTRRDLQIDIYGSDLH